MRSHPYLTGASALAALERVAAAPLRFISYGPGVRNWHKGKRNSIALRNRHTGQPHEHKRAIARRQRQAAA